jgi:hypothetical protein
MPGPIWPLAGRGHLQVVEWFQAGGRPGRHPEVIPLRTIYNTRTLEFEEIPLTEFQQLLMQGMIQEGITRSPDDGREQTVYRLIS